MTDQAGDSFVLLSGEGTLIASSAGRALLDQDVLLHLDPYHAVADEMRDQLLAAQKPIGFCGLNLVFEQCQFGPVIQLLGGNADDFRLRGGGT